MIKGNTVHDTIEIVKRDTIVKVVGLVSKEPTPKASTFGLMTIVMFLFFLVLLQLREL